MREELSNYIQCSTKKMLSKETNAKLIYEYTESVIKTQRESLDKLNTKLSGFLAYTGLMIKFVGDLSEKVTLHGFICYSCTSLVVLAYICLSISVLLLCLGLSVKPSFKPILPEKLMENDWYFADSSRILDSIISNRIEISKDYEKSALEKGKNLNLAIWLIALSLAIIIINTLIKIIWGE
jgi:hypothetical protein